MVDRFIEGRPDRIALLLDCSRLTRRSKGLSSGAIIQLAARYVRFRQDQTRKACRIVARARTDRGKFGPKVEILASRSTRAMRQVTAGPASRILNTLPRAARIRARSTPSSSQSISTRFLAFSPYKKTGKRQSCPVIFEHLTLSHHGLRTLRGR
jgi:hypothetical protein